MAEIELEINKKVGSEYASIMEAGQSLIPSYGPNRTGIRNLGNTCYIASVLQSLFALDDFRQQFSVQPQYKGDCIDNFWTQFERIGSSLTSGKYSTPITAVNTEGKSVDQTDEQEGISPGLFKSVVAKVSSVTIQCQMNAVMLK